MGFTNIRGAAQFWVHTPAPPLDESVGLGFGPRVGEALGNHLRLVLAFMVGWLAMIALTGSFAVKYCLAAPLE